MVQDASTTSSGSAPSAVAPEADRVDPRGNDAHSGGIAREVKEGTRGSNNPIQVEQDNRVDKAKADARAAGGGPAQPEDGLNQDG